MIRASIAVKTVQYNNTKMMEPFAPLTNDYIKVLRDKKCSYVPHIPTRPSVDDMLRYASIGVLTLTTKTLTFDPTYTNAMSCHFRIPLADFWCFKIVHPKFNLLKRTFVVCYINTEDAVTITFSNKEEANQYLKLIRDLQFQQMVEYKLSHCGEQFPDEDLPSYEESEEAFQRRFASQIPA